MREQRWDQEYLPLINTIKLFKERKAFLCTTISPALPYALFDRSITNATEVEDKCADMIVTEENPLDDLRALRHVKMVVSRGTITENPKVKINKRVETELDKFL